MYLLRFKHEGKVVHRIRKVIPRVIYLFYQKKKKKLPAFLLTTPAQGYNVNGTRK